MKTYFDEFRVLFQLVIVNHSNVHSSISRINLMDENGANFSTRTSFLFAVTDIKRDSIPNRENKGWNGVGREKKRRKTGANKEKRPSLYKRILHPVESIWSVMASSSLLVFASILVSVSAQTCLTTSEIGREFKREKEKEWSLIFLSLPIECVSCSWCHMYHCYSSMLCCRGSHY